MSLFWILLELTMMKVMSITAAIRQAKLQSNEMAQQTSIQLPTDHAVPVAHTTVSEH